MRLSGLHLLLTYQCILECDHCFVWGSPRQKGTMTLHDVQWVLQQAADVGTIEWIYFEGGEPFLYYAILLAGVRLAAEMGFRVGIVSNGFWATDAEDALTALKPFAGLVQDLSVSSDLYHWDEALSQQARNAREAAEKLNIPIGVISIAQPNVADAASASGQVPTGESTVMVRGRAAANLVAGLPRQPWTRFTECPHEDWREPGRVHLDPFGNLHICQGISMGNLFRAPLRELCQGYDADAHPIAGPLLAGGPAELIRRYELRHEEGYVDACHLCYEARRSLRERFPEVLVPDQMYGIF